jgi:hypothetical protein
VPFDKPVTVYVVSDEAVLDVTTVHGVPAAGARSTRYPIIDVADTFVGAVHERATAVSPAVAVSDVGASGATKGVAVTGWMYTPVPASLVAATRKAYVEPFVRPVAVYVAPTTDVVNVDHENPPSADCCTVYAVTALPPFEVGAVQIRTTCDVPAVAVRVAGATGVVNGVADATVLRTPVATALTALTRNE